MGSADARTARRPQWRGDRKAVLVRVPVDLAAQLTRAAEQRKVSVSQHVAELIAAALRDTDAA